MLASALLLACSFLAPLQAGSVDSRVELQPALEQLELDEGAEWFGAVRIRGDVPDGAELGVVLEVIFPGEGRVFALTGFGSGVCIVHPDSKEGGDGEDLFQTVAETKLSDRLTFRLPAVRSAPPRSFFRIRPTGGLLNSDGVTFALDDGRRPDFMQPLIVWSEVGYAVELRLNLPADATDLERAALVGRPLAFVGQAKGRMAAEDYEYAVRPRTRVEQAGAELVARLDLLPLQPLTYEPTQGTTDARDCLAPFYVSQIPEIQPTPGERSIIDVQLTRGITVAGEVLDEEGQPLSEATVGIICVRHRDPARSAWSFSYGFSRQPVRVKTGSDGRFLARAVPKDFSELRVNVRDKRPLVLSADDLAGAELLDLQLSIADGQTLFGRAVLPDGSPLVDSYVAFELPEGSQRWGNRGARTDPDGCFRVDGILDDQIALSVNGWRTGEAPTLQLRLKKGETGTRWLGRASARASETTLESPVELTVRQAAAIRGRVVAPEGQSLERCHVWVGGEFLVKHKARFSERTTNYSAKRFPIDPVTGEFEITGYEKGDVGVFAQVGGGKHAQSSQLVTFHASEIPERIELQLEPVAAFTGVLVDEEGRAIERAIVKVSKDSRWSLRAWRETHVDHEGRFRLEALAPGEYVATIEHQNYLLPEPATFVVEEGADSPPPITLQAVFGGRVLVHWDVGDGALRQEYGLPFLTDQAGQPLSSYASSRSAPKGSPKGSSRMLGPFLPGDYFAALRFQHGAEDGPMVTMREPVTVLGRATAQVRLSSDQLLRRAVEGRATDENGAALVGYRVSIERDGRSISRCLTDQEGRFALPFQSPMGEADAVTAKLTAQDASWTVAQKDLAHLEAGSTRVDWTLPTGSIQGSVGTGEEGPELWGRMMLEVVPLGADPGARVRGRSLRLLQRSFEIPHLAPGTYTLVGWRHAPGEGGRHDFHTRSEMATKPFVVKVAEGEAVKGVQLTVLGR
jgi:protocatechuate 3,4-dioxygenase beta subunit